MKYLIASSYTDRGDRKEINQDSILCKSARIGKNTAGLFIVADGCGGMYNGDQISTFVTASFNRFWNETIRSILINRVPKRKEIENMLDEELIRINEEAIFFANENGKKSGTTVSLLLIINKRFFIKNIGDSRIYRIRRGMKQLTIDQTVVEEMIRNKEITRDQARSHMMRHVLSMCLGYFKRLQIYSVSGRIRRKDIFLLCCDGLYNFLDEKDILKTVKRQKKKYFSDLAVTLRKMIVEGNAKDNVSAIIVKNGMEGIF